MKRRHQGTAVFMALLIIAIVAGMTAVVMRSEQIDIRRTEMMLDSQQIYLYAEGVVTWAKGQIIANNLRPTPTTVWPLILPPTPITQGQGMISGSLQDAQALINLNNFAQPAQAATNTPPQPAQGAANANPTQPAQAAANTNPTQPAQASGNNNSVNLKNKNAAAPVSAITNSPDSQLLTNLLKVLNINLSSTQQQALYNSLATPPVMLVSISELRTMSGITPAIYNQLSPYLIALPIQTTFDAAHAPPALQQASGTNSQSSPAVASTAVSSNYFLLRADVAYSDQHLVLFALLQMNPNQTAQNGPPTVSMLWQSFGTE